MFKRADKKRTKETVGEEGEEGEGGGITAVGESKPGDEEGASSGID